MGTPIKPKSFASTINTMCAGIHLATITNMKWARDFNGQQVATKDGEMAIDIHFENETGDTAMQRFWLTDKALWMLHSLCKAVGVDIEGRQPSKKEVLGKKLWLMVGAEYTFENADLERDSKGVPVARTRIVPKFMPVVGEMKPILEGDPARHPQGIPGGDFLLNTDLDIEAYWYPRINPIDLVTPSIREIAKAMPDRIIIADMRGKITPNRNTESPFKSDKELQAKGITSKETVVKQFNDDF